MLEVISCRRKKASVLVAQFSVHWKTKSRNAPDTDPHAIRANRLLEEAAVERERAKFAEPKDSEDGDAIVATIEMHPERQAALDRPETARVEDDPKNVEKGAWRKRG